MIPLRPVGPSESGPLAVPLWIAQVSALLCALGGYFGGVWASDRHWGVQFSQAQAAWMAQVHAGAVAEVLDPFGVVVNAVARAQLRGSAFPSPSVEEFFVYPGLVHPVGHLQPAPQEVQQ